ncbi:TonB-dependent receptor [Novosphingobium sp. HBC54]|uniref:TonB-dependent receptor n=2 Tax=Novosphingobium cyanobacteriorum TaxID=3024215 RepID=A0ABT6CFM2_9SPHN|nr:TonB-dependent receptor [Novosphingobium cyanobacteriorum]
MWAETDARAVEADDPQNNDILVVGRPQAALMEPASTGSRLGLTPLETPATVSIVDGDELRARGDLTIVDAVTRAPGISSSANPGNGGTALVVRGFSGQGSVLQLYDGIRLFPVAGTITFPADPFNVGRVEVLNGPSSVLYGQGALGGAVNVITKRPNTTRTEVDGEASYGAQNSWHVAAGAGGPLGNTLSYRADGSYRRSDGYVDRGESSSYALSAALRFAPSETFSLTLRDDYANQRPIGYFGTPLINGKLDTTIRRRNYNVADSNLHYRDNRLILTAEWSPSADISLSNIAYWLTSKRLFKNLESYCWIGANGDCPNGYNGTSGTPGTIYRTDNLVIFHDQAQIGDQGSIKWGSSLGGIRNDMVIGFDVNRVNLTYSNNFSSDLQEDFVNPQTFNPGQFLDTQGIGPRFRTRTTEYSLFIEDRLRFSDQLSIVVGLRDEHDRVYRQNIDSAGVIGPRLFTKTLHNTTWRIGTVYQPTATVSLYGQYSTGTDPLGTLTTYSGSQTQFSNATGNQVEIGAKASFLGGRGTASIAAYRIVKQGLLSQRTATSPIEQVGQRSSKGLEASITLDLPLGIGIDANGALLDARFDDFVSGTNIYTGKTPPGVPEESANVWLRWDAAKHVQVRAGLRYVGRTYSDNANAFRVPAYAVIDAGLSHAVTNNVAMDLRVYNLFDKDYATTTYNDEQWILGRPRSLVLTVRVHL